MVPFLKSMNIASKAVSYAQGLTQSLPCPQMGPTKVMAVLKTKIKLSGKPYVVLYDFPDNLEF
jgi:hypothetical protein